MNIESIHHTAVIVTDLERSMRFYSEVLGLKESDERPAFDFPGVWYEVGTMQIHLIVHKSARTLRLTDQIDTRDGHFALRVPDMSHVIGKLEQHGIAYQNKPDSITGWHQVFVTDPDGNIIEFNSHRQS
ncbi:VOC family protein [Paenibacillus sp. GCM10012307]|uniref:VOC family protein n=1 Tax=Paenibacillus roseus TaxID=2798579 RepID=A0A934MS03_9BACL|nr:VOC family protein [Paenibacillus roseus]MBJ6362829.1 VOC family protein [Paenibacillus roseus]